MDLFIGWASVPRQGQHFDIFMDNVDMVYMNIMICWNIIMVMCIYFGPAIDVCHYLQAVAVQFVQFDKQNNQ